MNFEIINRAGLTQREFGQLCGVSRVTVNLWATGRFRPNRYIVASVREQVKALEDAVAAGRLPLADSVPPKRRFDAINEALSHSEVAA